MQQAPPPGGAPSLGLQRVVTQIVGATGAPPRLVVAFLQHTMQALAQQMGPERAVQAMAQLLQRTPPQAFVQLLQEFANSPAGAGIGGPPGQVPPQGLAPANGPPGGVGPPPGLASPSSPLGPGGPPNPIGGPPPLPGGPQPQQPQRPPRPKKPKPRPDRADPWKPGELPKARYAGGPDYKTVIAHADEARRFYADLHAVMQEWRDIWHMVEDKRKYDRTIADDAAGGDVVHTRAQPTTMGKRIIGMTAPSLSRLGIQADPWDDTDECREAAQKCENFARYAIAEAMRAWNRRATTGDLRPPWDRTLSGLATIEGGYAFRVMPNPEDSLFPWSVEPVPLMEVRPRPLATIREVECPLGEAYAYEQLLDLLPPPREGETDPVYTDQTPMRLMTWTDETHYCMVAEFCEPAVREQVRQRKGVSECWIVKPTEHKLGRRIYLIPNPWDSDPLGPSTRDQRSRARYLAQGIYGPLVGTIKFVDKMVSALGTDVFKNIHRPKRWKLNTALRSAQPELFTPLDYDQAHVAGGNVVLDISEDVADIIEDLASTPSGQAFMQSLLGDLGDVAPPVMGGRGQAESGFDRFQASQAAGVLHVDPIIAYHCMSLEYLLETLLTDLARLGEGDGKLFTKVAYRSYKAGRGSTRRAGYMSTITAKDVRRNGPFVTVRFNDDNLTMQMQRTQLMLLQVKEHLRSRVGAMDELGIDDTERERMLMFAEAALEAPDVIKAAIKAALAMQAADGPTNEDGGVNESALMLAAIEDMEQKQLLGGGGPGGPAERGLPGMPSPQGGPPSPMPGSSAPPPVMMPGA